MTIKAVIFDIDGTLVHTKPDYIFNTVRRVLNELGNTIKLENKEITRFWFGMDRDEIISSWKIKPQDFWNSFRKQDDIDIRKNFIEAYGDIWVLEKMKENGIKLGALSNAPPWVVAINMEKIHVEFDCIINTFGTSVRPKPDPHGIEECMHLFGTKPDGTIMIGNGLEDHLAAKAAGVRDFFIDRKEHEIEIPSENRIGSLEELLDILEKNKAY